MKYEKQTEDNGKHYVYTHLRLDTNEIFYVGIGTKYNHDKDYTRAKAKGKQRNIIWRGIVSRTEYKILIILENDNYDLVKQKEIELVSLYGQIIKNTGTLCNLTDGGDGKLGCRDINIIKSVYLYHKTGEFYKEFEAIIDCTKFLQISNSVISLSINKEHLIKGFIIKDFKTDFVESILDIKDKLKQRLSKIVYQYDKDDNFIKEWQSTTVASKSLNISGGHIRECCSSYGRNTCGGFKWKYVKIVA